MEEDIPIYMVRPRFRKETDLTVSDLNNALRDGLRQANAPCAGSFAHGHFILRIPMDKRHYWSPQLSVTIEEAGEGRSLVRGLYGPKPTVWTMFVFFYSVIGIAVLLIAILGLSYWSLGKSTDILWFLPALIIVFLTLYLVAYFGKKMSQKQMHILHDFLEDTTCLKFN